MEGLGWRLLVRSKDPRCMFGVGSQLFLLSGGGPAVTDPGQYCDFTVLFGQLVARGKICKKITQIFVQPYLFNNHPEFKEKYTNRLGIPRRTRFWLTEGKGVNFLFSGFQDFGICVQ